MALDLEHLPSLALFARVVQLLRRTTRKLALTEEGLRLYAHCARLVEAAGASEASVAASSRSLAGPVRGNLTSNNAGVLRDAAVAGPGLLVIPRSMVAQDLAAGRLERVREGHRPAEVGLYAVTAGQGRQLPARTRALLDFLARRFSGPGWP